MSGVTTEQAKGVTRPALGLYVHVPFCASTCDFCAFYQTQPTADGVKRFLLGIESEAALIDWPGPVTTVFWGGGTPGLLAPRDLERLAAIVRARCGGQPREWTVELAPASVTDERLKVLREAGVTRVSMGVQSFQPELLDALGRQHTREQVFRAYDRVRAAGFRSVNLDLMFALPGQTAAEWAGDVREAVALAPDHLSTYCLTFEEDTKLWVKLSQGRVKLDTDHEAALYEATWSQLADTGFAQYEVSNFSRPGHECLHNLNTWRMNEWVGLGPSAASQHAGWRGANVADLEKWHAGLDVRERMTEDRVQLTPALLAEDALIFGLRMNAGVDLAPWQQRAPEAPWPVIDDTLATLAANELLVRTGNVVKLTNRGRLVADSVAAEIMAAFEPITETACMCRARRLTASFAAVVLLLTRVAGAAEHALVLQTDFGLRDGAVGAMRGIASGVSARLPVHDLSHENAAFDIWEGAYRLKQAAPFWPEGTVFVSVIDPGVGTNRTSIVMKSKSGHLFVTPNNGTLTLIAEDLGVAEVRLIDETKHRRPGSDRSYTFHGRDIFAYVGARLAAGAIRFDEVGPVLTEALVTLHQERPRHENGTLIGMVPILDARFGNVWTNLTEEIFAELKPAIGDRFRVEIAHGGKIVYAGEMPYAKTFGDVPEGEPLLYLNSLLHVAFALNRGDFARTHRIGSGGEWTVRVQKARR